jgi:hypothetical protein
MNDSRHGNLLGKVEWFLMLETKAQDFVIGKIDAAVFVYVEFVPPSTLSLFEIKFHLELVLWCPDAWFK